MSRLLHLLALFVLATTHACGYELDPNLDDYYPYAVASEPSQCIEGYICSARSFCVRAAGTDCASYEEGDTRCNTNAVEICRAGAWEPDQNCDDIGQACVEVARSLIVTFACRSM